MKITKSEVEFNVGKKHIKFTIIHDLPNKAGLSFDNALQNWIARTTDFTAESLCKYILSKNTVHIAMTEEQFQKAKQ